MKRFESSNTLDGEVKKNMDQECAFQSLSTEVGMTPRSRQADPNIREGLSDSRWNKEDWGASMGRRKR